MIEVRQLDFEYPSKRVLHGISFDVDPGAITALVGLGGYLLIMEWELDATGWFSDDAPGSSRAFGEPVMGDR